MYRVRIYGYMSLVLHADVYPSFYFELLKKTMEDGLGIIFIGKDRDL